MKYSGVLKKEKLPIEMSPPDQAGWHHVLFAEWTIHKLQDSRSYLF